MSHYFNEEEFICKCGCNQLPANGMDTNLYAVLDAIREQVGEPVFILSGYRCPQHNREVGGVPNSQHVLGTASDITTENITVETLAQIAENCLAELGVAGGVGRYPSQGFVHVDTCQEPANRRWDENDY